MRANNSDKEWERDNYVNSEANNTISLIRVRVGVHFLMNCAEPQARTASIDTSRKGSLRDLIVNSRPYLT